MIPALFISSDILSMITLWLLIRNYYKYRIRDAKQNNARKSIIASNFFFFSFTNAMVIISLNKRLSFVSDDTLLWYVAAWGLLAAITFWLILLLQE